MKKIIILCLVMSCAYPLVLAEDTVDGGSFDEVVVLGTATSKIPLINVPDPTQINIKNANEGLSKISEELQTANAKAKANAAQKSLGIVINTDCMTSVGCSMDVGVMLWLKTPAPAGSEDANRTSVLTLVQDIVLAATFFIGTVITLALIFSGLLFVFSGADSSKKKLAISWIKNSIIGLALVAGSYAIIRFIQFLASGG